MFGKDFFQKNRQKLRDSFAGEAMVVLSANAKMEKGVDSTYPFSQDSNFWYLSGIDEPEVIVVIEERKESIILPYRSRANEIFDGSIDKKSLVEASGISNVYDNEKGMKWLRRKIKKAKFVATLTPPPIYDNHNNSYTNPAKRQLASDILAINPEVQFIDVTQHISSLRVIKERSEISAMKKASNETVKIFKDIHAKFGKFQSESELDIHIKLKMIKNKLQFAYDPIIAGGEHSNVLHYQGAGDGKVDDLVLLDIGVEYGGYASDVSRTYFDSSNERYSQVHNALLDVFDFACSLVMPGMTMINIEQRTRQYMGEKLRELGLIDIINQDEIAKFFPHALGHFVGLDVHDSRDPELQLKSGMVITIEPGIYINEEKFGMRHEDTLLVTDSGYENLTESAPTVDSRREVA